jgi:hypothetical protein
MKFPETSHTIFICRGIRSKDIQRIRQLRNVGTERLSLLQAQQNSFHYRHLLYFPLLLLLKIIHG